MKCPQQHEDWCWQTLPLDGSAQTSFTWWQCCASQCPGGEARRSGVKSRSGSQLADGGVQTARLQGMNDELDQTWTAQASNERQARHRITRESMRCGLSKVSLCTPIRLLLDLSYLASASWRNLSQCPARSHPANPFRGIGAGQFHCSPSHEPRPLPNLADLTNLVLLVHMPRIGWMDGACFFPSSSNLPSDKTTLVS